MAWSKLVIFCVLQASTISFAQTVAYKYQINSTFGVRESCTNDGENEISQVRFYINTKQLNSSQNFIPAQIKITACVWGGSLIKETNSVMVPKFMFANGGPLLDGNYTIESSQFSKIHVSRIGQNAYRLRYFQQGQSWKLIDPIELTLVTDHGQVRPDKIRFYIVQKGKWLESKFRKMEVAE